MKLQLFKSRDELHWASGLFEGEGWISIQGFSPALGIQSSDKDVLERFALAVGGGSIHTRKPRIYAYEHIQTRKPQWAWRIGGFQNVQYVIALLWSGLSKRRKERIKEVLDVAKLGNTRKGNIIGSKRKPYGPKRVRKHGEAQKYWQGCRCELCCTASKKYHSDLRLRNKEKAPRINRSYNKQIIETVTV